MDSLSIIQRVMQEHRLFEGSLSGAEQTLSDRNALEGIERAHADLTDSAAQPLAEKRARLLDSLETLRAGLVKHYRFEEEMLPPLLGEWLMEALHAEHRALLGELEAAQSVIASVRLEGMTRDEALSEQSLMWALVNRIRHQKEGHVRREEVILEMVLKAVRDKAGASAVA